MRVSPPIMLPLCLLTVSCSVLCLVCLGCLPGRGVAVHGWLTAAASLGWSVEISF